MKDYGKLKKTIHSIEDGLVSLGFEMDEDFDRNWTYVRGSSRISLGWSRMAVSHEDEDVVSYMKLDDVLSVEMCEENMSITGVGFALVVPKEGI